jgi:hypothetical protein
MKKGVLGFLLIVFLIGLVSSFNGSPREIRSVNCFVVNEEVYNFKINEYENYYAEEVLVHNKYDFERMHVWRIWGEEDDLVGEIISDLINDANGFPEELLAQIGVTRKEMLRDWNKFVRAAKAAELPISQWEFQGIQGFGESHGMHLILFKSSNINIVGEYIPEFLKDNVAFSWFLSQYGLPGIKNSWGFLDNPQILLEKEYPFSEDFKAFDQSNFVGELFGIKEEVIIVKPR